MNITQAQTNKICKHCNRPFDATPFRAWGQIITPVNCKDCRKMNFYFSKNEREKRTIRDIHNHDCKKSNCGYICTFGDW